VIICFLSGRACVEVVLQWPSARVERVLQALEEKGTCMDCPGGNRNSNMNRHDLL
jgi:hypothetical protein